MKRRIKILIISLIFTVTLATLEIFLNLNKDDYIDDILKGESYAYLPVEAQKYIKEVYEETGTVILTEKNKVDNVGYLNPQYVEYLTLSDEEKESVDLVPDVYSFDYSFDDTYTSSDLPSKYDLRDLDGENYLSSMKNQGSLGLCWAIATVENAETYLMLKNSSPYGEESQIFSVRQMDYATSTNGLKYNGGSSDYIWSNEENGYRTLTGAGNFYMSSIVMANGLSLVDDGVLPWSESTENYYASDILDYANSKYEVDSTIQLSQINADTATDVVINSYVNEVKNYIIEYGGLFVGTYSPQSTCGFLNTDGKNVLKTDDCISANTSSGHAMQIIGWDDEYEYAYCDYGTKHYSVSNDSCSKGTYTKGKGVWILRNSWGDDTNYKYIYLTYNSTRLSVSMITSMSDMGTRSWDNNYHSNPWGSGSLSFVSSQSQEVNTHNDKAEKVEKVKFFAASEKGTYTLSISSDNNSYDTIAVANIEKAGIYTFDLSDKNIVMEDANFFVKITGSYNSVFFNDSISVFTSNVDEEAKVITYSSKALNEEERLSLTNPLYVSGDDYWNLNLKFYTKNIPANGNITYRLRKDDNLYNTFSEFYNLYILNDKGEARFDGSIYTSYLATSESKSFNINTDGYGQTFTLEILYEGEVVDSFPIKFIGNGKITSSSVKFYNGNGESYTITVTDKTTFDSTKSSLASSWFDKNKYIKSWNTQIDGSGTSYDVNNILVFYDMELYAQWSSKNSYKLSYSCDSELCYLGTGESSLKSLSVSYDEEVTLGKSPYHYGSCSTDLECSVSDDLFLYWKDDNNIFYEEEKVTNLAKMESPFGDESVNLVATFAESNDLVNVINFDANGGVGSMSKINVLKDNDSRIKYNLFTREGYTFKGWNTKANGTGTVYTDGQIVNISEDMTLYAQWEENSYTITFDANGGVGSEISQDVLFNRKVNLLENTYTKEGYTFKEWNTKANGTGTSYEDCGLISVTGDLTLYAIWEINKYSITFNSNDGTDNTIKQEFLYGKKANLTKNTFTKGGYTFKEWNTEANGLGKSYIDEQFISVTEDMVLYAIWQENYDYVINKYTYDNNLNIIKGIPITTSINTYKKNFKLNTDYKMEVDTAYSVLNTGSKTKIYYKDNLYKEYTNVVLGDINGDGLINSADLLKIRQHLLGTKTLSGVYYMAADINSDDKINSTDLLRVRQHLLGSKYIS